MLKRTTSVVSFV